MAEEKEKPLTREDVLRLIQENGGRAKGLDLSEKEFEAGIDLRGQNLHGIILRDASLERANLERTDLTGAHLEGAYLGTTHLEGANLQYAHFEDSLLDNIELSNDTRLENAHWGNYVVSWEIEDYLIWAISVYRQLKTWHTNAGIYHTAGEFFFREMTVKRKMLQWWPNPLPRLWSKLLSLICGYGERPLRVIGWAASVVSVLALIYFIIGSVWEWRAFWNSLYFSAVSFTALGYGSWLEISNDWIKGLGAFESFIGVFTIALFLVTFIRKMTR